MGRRKKESYTAEPSSETFDWDVGSATGPDGPLKVRKKKEGREVVKELTLNMSRWGLDDDSLREYLTPQLQDILVHVLEDLYPDASWYHIDVDLSNNSLGPDGASTLVEFLRQCPRKSSKPVCVRQLMVYRNNIRDEGIRSIARLVMSQPEPLHEIHLSHNGVTAMGASVLALALGNLNPNGTYPFVVRDRRAPCWCRLEHNFVEEPVELVSALNQSGDVRVFESDYGSKEWGPLRCPSHLKTPSSLPQVVLHIFRKQDRPEGGAHYRHGRSPVDFSAVIGQAREAVQSLLGGEAIMAVLLAPKTQPTCSALDKLFQRKEGKGTQKPTGSWVPVTHRLVEETDGAVTPRAQAEHDNNGWYCEEHSDTIIWRKGNLPPIETQNVDAPPMWTGPGSAPERGGVDTSVQLRSPQQGGYPQQRQFGVNNGEEARPITPPLPPMPPLPKSTQGASPPAPPMPPLPQRLLPPTHPAAAAVRAVGSNAAPAVPPPPSHDADSDPMLDVLAAGVEWLRSKTDAIYSISKWQQRIGDPVSSRWIGEIEQSRDAGRDPRETADWLRSMAERLEEQGYLEAEDAAESSLQRDRDSPEGEVRYAHELRHLEEGFKAADARSFPREALPRPPSVPASLQAPQQSPSSQGAGFPLWPSAPSAQQKAPTDARSMPAVPPMPQGRPCGKFEMPPQLEAMPPFWHAWSGGVGLPPPPCYAWTSEVFLGPIPPGRAQEFHKLYKRWARRQAVKSGQPAAENAPRVVTPFS